jgi:uncharacterized MAPEG superfamily protein
MSRELTIFTSAAGYAFGIAYVRPVFWTIGFLATLIMLFVALQ